MFGKILVFQLLAKMLSANQIARFFKLEYLLNSSRYQLDFFCMEIDIYCCYKLIILLLLGNFRCGCGRNQAFSGMPKCAEIKNFEHLNNDLSYCFDFLHAGLVPWELQINCHIFDGSGQTCPGITKVCRNNKFSISLQWVKLLLWFYASIYNSMRAAN